MNNSSPVPPLCSFELSRKSREQRVHLLLPEKLDESSKSSAACLAFLSCISDVRRKFRALLLNTAFTMTRVIVLLPGPPQKNPFHANGHVHKVTVVCGLISLLHSLTI